MIVKKIGEELTEKEIESLKENPETSRLINQATGDVIVYQKDEPEPEPVVYKEPPNWNGLTQSLWSNMPLMGKAMQTALPNVYSTLLKVLTDGEINSASENAFIQMFNMLGVSWTKTEKDTINSYLEANNFTVRV